MSTATLTEFWITTGGRRWKARFAYPDLTPSRTQRPNKSATVTLSNGTNGTVIGTQLDPDGVDGKRVVVVSGQFETRVVKSDGYNLTVSADAFLFDDAYGNATEVIANAPVLNRSLINDTRDGWDLAIPDHTVPGYGTAADLSHANLYADLNPELDDFVDQSLHDFAIDHSGNSHNGYCRTPGVDARRIEFRRDHFGAGKHAYASIDSARIRIDASTNGSAFSFDFATTSFAGIYVGEANGVGFVDGGFSSLNFDAFGAPARGLSTALNARRVHGATEKLVWGFLWDHTTGNYSLWLNGRKVFDGNDASPSNASELVMLLAPASSLQDYVLQRMAIYSSSVGVPLSDSELVERMSRAMLDYAVAPRTHYISAMGNDANDGLSDVNPILTVSEALARFRPQTGEQIRIRFGDTFADFGVSDAGSGPGMVQGSSWQDRAIVCGYGDRSDGRYDFSLNGFTMGEYSLLSGVDFTNPSGDPDEASFDEAGTIASPVDAPISFSGSSGHEDMILIDGFIQGRMNGVLGGSAENDGSWLELYQVPMRGIWGQGQSGRPQGVYTTEIDYFHAEDVPMRRPGHTGDGNRTIYDHGFYLYAKYASVDSNIIEDASSDGIKCRFAGEVTGNVLLRCPLGITSSTGGQGLFQNLLFGGSTQAASGAARQIWTASGVFTDAEDNLIIADADVIPSAVAIYATSTGYFDNQGDFNVDADWEHHLRRNTIVGDWSAGIAYDDQRLANVGVLTETNNVIDCGSGEITIAESDIAQVADRTIEHNLRASTDATPFSNNGVAQDETAWDAASGENSPAVRSVSPSYLDRTRTPLTWHERVKGGDGTYDGLILDIIAAHEDGWDASWSADAINEWVRDGFTLIGESAANFGGTLPGITVDAVVSEQNIIVDQAPDDGTINLGNIAVGSVQTVPLNIRNNAPQPGQNLTLGGVSVSAGGTLTVDPSLAVIAAGSSEAAEVTIDTAAPGARAITLQIPSDDPDNPIYTITINATVLSVQDIAVDEGAHNGSIDLGSVALGAATNVDLTIRNAAQAPGSDLTLGVLSVTAGGAITTNPSNQTIAAGASTAATINVDTATAGARSIEVQIPSDDPDTPAYAITINATVVGADLQITLDDNPVVNGGELELEGLIESMHATITLDITNAGMADLTLGTIMTSGNLSITANGNPSGEIIPSLESVTLEILIDTSVVGAVSGSISVPSDDPDSPWGVTAQGVVAASANPSDDYTGPDTTQQYLNVAEADAIIALYLIGAHTFRQAWQSLSADDKLVLIAHATIDFNAIPWDGRKVDPDQPNAFPRENRDGDLILPGGEVQYPPSLGGGEWSYPSLPREIRVGVALQAAARAADQLEIDQSMKITGMAAQGITGIGGAGTSWATDGMIARQPSSRLHESVRRLVQKYLRVTAEVV
ncbi:choice-of-anchor D domain-containing protein [Synechococcus sp. N5]|uniref:choice-of-anchor D domain-containing protein n=1 Tax=Synechococcus sp. N5 TaxID=2575515 RepID=UPI000E0E936E|nr:choice-of-anchor D domain-containing protein [Synechococcus sp. N5]